MILQIHTKPRPLPVQSTPSKVLLVMAAHLQSQDIMIYLYLDDCLLRACAFAEAQRVTQTTLDLLKKLGLQINAQILPLIPVQRLEYIGADLNSV